MRAEALSAAQVKAVFDADPEEIRILCVQTIIQNEGEVQYLITRTGMRLLTRQGVALTLVSPSRVAKKMRVTHDGLAVGSVFLFGVLSYPSFQSANEASDAMVKACIKPSPSRSHSCPIRPWEGYCISSSLLMSHRKTA